MNKCFAIGDLPGLLVPLVDVWATVEIPQRPDTHAGGVRRILTIVLPPLPRLVLWLPSGCCSGPGAGRPEHAGPAAVSIPEADP